jgi:2-iminobutanoate/2-iminopropanoate deaminase
MNARTLAAALLALALTACNTASKKAPPEFLSSPQGAALKLPFSEAVRAGGFLILAGQLGNKPGTRELSPGGIGPESRQAMDNIKAVLGRHGATLDDVVKCTVFLADMAEWPAFNDVYSTYFPSGRFPARSALGANGLALGARVEVECIAYPADASR